MPTNSKDSLVAIIILNWNGLADTLNCLNSLSKVQKSNFEVFVLDNGSNKNEASAIKKIKALSLHVYRSETNLGYAGGCNYLINKARKMSPEFYLLLNNDVEVSSNFLLRLISSINADNSIGIISPLIMDYYDRTKVEFGGGHFNWLTAKFIHKKKALKDRSIETFITGCCMLIKKELVNKYELLDEGFFAYFEDAALCLTARKQNYNCAIEPTSIVFHKVSATAGRGIFQTYLVARNRILYVNKYLPRIYAAYFNVFNFAKLCFAVCLFTAKRDTSRRKAYISGYLHGMQFKSGAPRI
jgi:GT2 family glycosyltransferase